MANIILTEMINYNLTFLLPSTQHAHKCINTLEYQERVMYFYTEAVTSPWLTNANPWYPNN